LRRVHLVVKDDDVTPSALPFGKQARFGGEIAARRIENQNDQVHGADARRRVHIRFDCRRDHFFARALIVPQRGDQRTLAHARGADERQHQRALRFFRERTQIELLECRPNVAEICPASH
jgi:hypothetical protein